MKDGGATPNSGRHPWAPVRSPKQSESDDGVHKATSKTLPSGSAKPDGKMGGR